MKKPFFLSKPVTDSLPVKWIFFPGLLFFLTFFSFSTALAETLIDYSTLSGSESNTSFNNVSYQYQTVDTREFSTIDSITFRINDNASSYTFTVNAITPAGSIIGTSTVSSNSSGIGSETFTFSPSLDVSSYDSIVFRLKNSNGAYITTYYINDSTQSFGFAFSKYTSFANGFDTRLAKTIITGSFKPDDCPVCEVCDYDDDIPYGVPFLNDVTMVTGYTESYDASTSEMLTVEKKYYHIPAVAVFFLSTVIIIVMSRLLAEVLKRISQR